MSCVRSSWLLYRPVLRSTRLRLVSSSSGSEGDSGDERKTKQISSLMSALEGLKVDGAHPKMKIGFSAAAQFKKQKLQKASDAAVTAKQKPAEKSQEEETRLHQAAEEVSRVFPDQKRTQSELLEQLMRTKATEDDTENISDVLSGIKVEKGGPSSQQERITEQRGHHSQVSFDSTFSNVSQTGQSFGDGADQEMGPHYHQRRNTLFDHQRLNIFQPCKETPTDVKSISEERMSIWEVEADKEKRGLLAETIRNGFEEMIEMTKEGKIWTYPIDNEKGLEEEQKVPFYDHVFLDGHLEGFPEIPEVMNFMELVLIGLGKNPYLTVQQKREHIDWFREYFDSKMDILKESTSAKS